MHNEKLFPLGGFGQRHKIGALLAFAYLISYSIRYSIGISVTAMVNVAANSNDSAHYLVGVFSNK